MKTLYLIILALFCTIGTKAQPWIGPVPGNIYYNQGNVGIGTSTPQANADISTGGNMLLPNTSGSTNTAILRVGYGDHSWAGGQLDMGINNAGSYPAWIQVRNPADYSVNRNLLLNPNGGNIGIGTTNPTYQLQIGTNGGLTNSIRIGSYQVANNTRQYIGYARYDTGLFESSGDGDTPNTVKAGVSGIRIVNSIGSLSPTQADNSVQLLTHIYNGGSRVALHANYNGNIGIGTTNPGAKLSVNGAINILGETGLPTTITGLGTGLVFSGYNATGVVIGRTYIGDGTGYSYLLSKRTGGVTTDLVTFNDNGNVGIGILTPSNKLEVNGTIRAKEIKVESGWADYVFDQGYNLQDLSEVELYINKHKHLPDVPGANEVEKNGVNLGEMNALLLKKIEELTLYSIYQNKSLKDEAKKNEELAKKIESLEKAVNNLISK